jgi:hypothetical protein
MVMISRRGHGRIPHASTENGAKGQKQTDAGVLKEGRSHGPDLLHEIQTKRDKDNGKSRVFTMVGCALPLW